VSHMNESFQVRSSHAESCPYRHLSVLCWLFLLYEHMEGSIYGFRVEGIEVTDGAKVTEMAEMAEVSEMAEKARVSKVIQMTTRHVIWPVAEKAEISIKTTRHVMWRSLGKVAV
jgi:hypothetical protein